MHITIVVYRNYSIKAVMFEQIGNLHVWTRMIVNLCRRKVYGGTLILYGLANLVSFAPFLGHFAGIPSRWCQTVAQPQNYDIKTLK